MGKTNQRKIQKVFSSRKFPDQLSEEKQQSQKANNLPTCRLPWLPCHLLRSQNAKRLRQWDPSTVWQQQRSFAERPEGRCFPAGSFTYKTGGPICLGTGAPQKSLHGRGWNAEDRRSGVPAQGEINKHQTWLFCPCLRGGKFGHCSGVTWAERCWFFFLFKWGQFWN